MGSAPETTLVIRHVFGSTPPQFQVERLAEGSITHPAEILSPGLFPIEGIPEAKLAEELRWYLEDFPEFPFKQEAERANKIERALRRWGETAFNALFGSREAGGLFDAAIKN